MYIDCVKSTLGQNCQMLISIEGKKKQAGIKLQYFCQYGDRKKKQPKNKVKHIYFGHYRIRIDHKV